MSFLNNLGGPLWRSLGRTFSTNAFTEGENRIINILKQKFPAASKIQVHDISGGCGSMYEIHITSEEFRGHRMVKQHKMVNEALKEEIKGMHGLRINTTLPSS